MIANILLIPIDIVARLYGAFILSDVCIRVYGEKIKYVYGSGSNKLINDISLVCQQNKITSGYIYLTDKKAFISARFLGQVSRIAQIIRNIVNL